MESPAFDKLKGRAKRRYLTGLGIGDIRELSLVTIARGTKEALLFALYSLPGVTSAEVRERSTGMIMIVVSGGAIDAVENTIRNSVPLTVAWELVHGKLSLLQRIRSWCWQAWRWFKGDRVHFPGHEPKGSGAQGFD